MSATKNYSTYRTVLITIVFLASLGIITAPVQAELATYDEAHQVAENFVTQILSQKGFWAGNTQVTVTEVMEIRAGDTLVAWSFAVSPKGFVLVSALKELNPIIAYSDESNLDASHEDGPLSMAREMLGTRATIFAQAYGSLEAVQPQTGNLIFDPAGREAWTRLEVPSVEFQSALAHSKMTTMAEAGPLTTTLWHQSGPYNNVCPTGDGGRTLVGCVATATAQVMAYWQWPANGVGSYSYNWSGDNSCGGSTPSQVLTADFSDPYDWDNIVNTCDGGCSSAQNDALAELCYEVAVSHSMSFGVCGSGAWTAGAANVLRDYFKYSPEINVINRSNYTQQSWYDAMVVEIDAGRVVQYRINLHSIVMDGYRDNSGQLEYHMNYGWGDGSFNAWFVIDQLYCYWVTGDVCPYDEEYMIRNIFPQNESVLSYVSYTADDPAGDGDGHGEAGEEIEINAIIRNDGVDALNASAILTCSNPYITIIEGTVAFETSIPWGSEANSLTPFRVQIDPSAPDPLWIEFEISISSDGGYTADGSFVVFAGEQAGLEDDIESGQGFWTQMSIRTGYVDDWHIETYRKHSGNSSWKMGGAGAANYSDLSDAALMSPPVLIPTNGALTFWHWMDIEVAWDGGIVMISTPTGSWEQIFPEEGYTHNIIDNAASPFAPETPCYSGSFDWTQATFDLSAYSGNVAQIMFRFGADGGANEEGWYVDDVSIFSNGCCGAFTSGQTGNTNCSVDGFRDLSDITRLIDNVYITKEDLCCLENGNTDGDLLGGVDLADITALIDHVYITQGETAACL